MKHKLTREMVLEQFAAAAELPDADLVRTWTERYPEFSEDIVAFATDWLQAELFVGPELDDELDDSLVNRTMSRVQKLSFDHEKQSAQPKAVTVLEAPRVVVDSLEHQLARHNIELVKVLKIDESVLALFEARMIKPDSIPARILDAFAQFVGREFVQAWVTREPVPVLAHRAHTLPKVVQVTFIDAVMMAPDLPDEIKREWQHLQAPAH